MSIPHTISFLDRDEFKHFLEKRGIKAECINLWSFDAVDLDEDEKMSTYTLEVFTGPGEIQQF